MDFKHLADRLLETLRAHPNLLIYIKGSPDPDALAASFVLKLVGRHVGSKGEIFSPLRPSLLQNSRFVKELRLPVRFEEPENVSQHFDGYAITDHQSIAVEGLTGVVPCAIHIDHHEQIEEKVPVDLKIVMEETGSTCTILVFILEELKDVLKMGPELRQRVATALHYGIQTDTDDFQYAEPLDDKAAGIISPYCDKGVIRKLSSLPFSKESMNFLERAWENRFIYRDWFISGLGYIDEKYRDEVAVLGDFLLKQQDFSTVVLYFLIEREEGLTLNASFRTREKDFNMNALIKRIAKNGGARRFKGAFQVDLDYFKHADRVTLWKLVSETTVEALKKQRDARQMEDFKDYFRNLRTRFVDLFK